MPAPQRRRDTALISTLFSNPHRYGFFQAVRVLEHWLTRLDETPDPMALVDRLRFPSCSSLAFPPSEIAAIAADDFALAARPAGLIRLTPACFGLLGAQGTLPHYFTEVLAEWEARTRDNGTRAFLDMFSTRAAALFYGAWKKYRLPLRHELDADAHYRSLLLAVGGLGHPALQGRLAGGLGGICDESLAHYAGAMRQRPMSSAYLQSVLGDYFELPVRVEPFVGKWYTIPPQHATQLGREGTVLGAGALAGDRVWKRDLRMRVWIGPVDRQGFLGFLPDGAKAKALGQLIGLLMGTGCEYEVRVILRKEDVRGCELKGEGCRLGYDAFLCTRDESRDRDDVVYELRRPFKAA